MEIREHCSCGADFLIQATVSGIEGLDKFLAPVSKWRTSHRCPNRATKSAKINSGDWREEHVGKLCSACGFRLDKKEELTTLYSKPLHIRCRVCYLCSESKPYSMQWLKISTGRDKLIHPKCLKFSEKTHAPTEPSLPHPDKVIEGQVLVGAIIDDTFPEGERSYQDKVQYARDTWGSDNQREQPVQREDHDQSEGGAGTGGESLPSESGDSSAGSDTSVLPHDERVS